MRVREKKAERRTSAGNAAVEFALVLPLLLSLLMGMLDYGYFFFVSQIVTNASREAARAGTLHLDQAASEADAQATLTAYLTRVGLDPGRAAVSTATATADNVTVQLEYPAGSLTGMLTGLVPERAVAQATMRIR